MALRQVKIFQKTSYALAWLVFWFLCFSCSNEEEQPKEVSRDVFVVYENTKPIGFDISRDLLKNIPDDSLLPSLTIHLEKNSTPILGELIAEESYLVFRPALPFTEGLKYEIRLGGELITTKYISPADLPGQTEVQAVYPSPDTVPENLLKFYIEFSDPMQQGHALEHIALVRNGKDTLSGVFLDLQPELWNKENTMLTVWLDPGRIKRDLQPNQKMGAPLQKENSYKLLVKKGWRDTKGNAVRADFEKEFFVGPRDSLRPAYQSWAFSNPSSKSQDDLVVDLKESLDYQLLKSAIRILDNNGNGVAGRFTPDKNETILLFSPEKKWRTGEYVLEIESRLEDLAGNNLNRLFERDISKKDTLKTKEVYSRSFRIQ